jgi:multiple sugar transport system substrate-binding protein
VRVRFLVSLLLGLAFAGCGGPGEEEKAGVTELKIVIWKPDSPGSWDEALARFHASHPDIRVALEVGPNNSTQFHDLLTQKLRNREPSVDAFLMDVIWTPEFAQAGWVIALDDRFPPAERERFFPACIEADTYRGSIYGVPFNTDAGLLFYRRDLLDARGFAAPRTWEEMLSQIAAIEAAEQDPRLFGYSGQFKQYEGLVCDMLEFVQSNGGDLWEPDAPATVEAVRFVRDRIVGDVAPRGVLTYKEQQSLDLFTAGGAIFHRNWPYAWAVCADSPIAGKVGISVLPTFVPGLSTAALGGWRFGISAFSRHPEETWRFVAFMTSPEIQKLFTLDIGKPPARRALYEDADVLAKYPHFASLRSVFESATPRPRSPVYPQISHILQRYFHAALSDPGSDIPALAAEAAEKIRRVRDRNPG